MNGEYEHEDECEYEIRQEAMKHTKHFYYKL